MSGQGMVAAWYAIILPGDKSPYLGRMEEDPRRLDYLREEFAKAGGLAPLWRASVTWELVDG